MGLTRRSLEEEAGEETTELLISKVHHLLWNKTSPLLWLMLIKQPRDADTPPTVNLIGIRHLNPLFHLKKKKKSQVSLGVIPKGHALHLPLWNSQLHVGLTRATPMKGELLMLFFTQEGGTDVYDCTPCNPSARPDRKPASPQTRYAQFADTLADLSTEMPELVIGPALSSVRMKHT